MDIDSADDDDTAAYRCNVNIGGALDSNATGVYGATPENRIQCAMDTSGDGCSTDTSHAVYDNPSHIASGPCKTTRLCWLCEYQGNRTTNEVIRFIMDGIPHMSLGSLVEQSKFLLDQVNVGSNATSAEIKKHITEHMLHPRVKLALQMQEMSRMQRQVGKCCISADVETGEQTINPQAMRVYLTLCSQISGVYKLGEDKLMYNQGSMDK